MGDWGRACLYWRGRLHIAVRCAEILAASSLGLAEFMYLPGQL